MDETSPTSRRCPHSVSPHTEAIHRYMPSSEGGTTMLPPAATLTSFSPTRRPFEGRVRLERAGDHLVRRVVDGDIESGLLTTR